MNDPRRLLEDDGVAARLLSTWRDDVGSVEAQRRILDRLTAAGHLPTVPSQPPVQAVPAPTGAAGGAAFGFGASLPWAFAAAIAAGAMIAFGVTRHPDDSRARIESASAPETAVTSLPEIVPDPVSPAREIVPPSPALPSPAPSPRTVQPRRSSSSEPPPAATEPAPATPRSALSLSQEIALLDRARNAVNRGRPADALALLGEHDRDYPGGVLGPEAELVRVEALLHMGDRTSAEQAAKRFISAHPSSPHVRRLESMLARRDAGNPE